MKLISLLFQGNQSAPERSSYEERYKFSYGKRYASLSIVYWLFVRIISFKILLFPIIDSLGNPLIFYIIHSFFENLDHQTWILSDKHPMAKWVWVLVGSTIMSIDPLATMFSINRQNFFSASYVDCGICWGRKQRMSFI